MTMKDVDIFLNFEMKPIDQISRDSKEHLPNIDLNNIIILMR